MTGNQKQTYCHLSCLTWGVVTPVDDRSPFLCVDCKDIKTEAEKPAETEKSPKTEKKPTEARTQKTSKPVEKSQPTPDEKKVEETPSPDPEEPAKTEES